MHRTIAWPVLLVTMLISGCVTTGSKNMETVVTDMHQRVGLLDKSMGDSLVRLNETTANLMARVNENEQQVRLLKSLMEENQRKLDKLLSMLEALTKTLYRHWGLAYSPAPMPRRVPETVEVKSPPPAAVVNSPAESASAPPLQSTSASNEEGDYSSAKERYDGEDYPGAITAFSDFMSAYPQSAHCHKAQFWIGKSFLNQSEYSKAIEAFEKVRRDYPESSYMPFVLHNQAVAHYRLGDREVAVALMEEVVSNYPTSTASEHARRDLDQLRSGSL